MTSELRAEISSPTPAFFSSTMTSRPLSASSRAIARPTTPAPMTTTSVLSLIRRRPWEARTRILAVAQRRVECGVSLVLRWPPSLHHTESSRMESPTAASIEQVDALLRGRRSVDLYEPDPVPSAVVRDAIDVARWAPNHRLTQPWRFYLIGPATRRGVTDLAVELDVAKKGERAGPIRRARLDAVPGFLVITTRRSDDALLEREDYAACC